jgi:DNA repair photolyase
MFDEKRKGTGTQEWAEVTENIQRGCVNNCLYCYAAANAKRFALRNREDWAREELTKRSEITSYPARAGVIMFPSSHDITPFNVDAYIRVARLILAKKNRLLIVTKPSLACVDKIMRELDVYREQILFRFTIGATNEALTALWEPGAPDPLERLDALALAEERGFARSISIEPMLAGVEETMRVVKNVAPWGPATIWIGKMNKIRLRVDDQTPEILAAMRLVEDQQRDSEILRLYEALPAALYPTIRWKDSIKLVLAAAGVLS